ncbi:MAG: SRPBCC family protein [Aggregatilineales bacterium]
MAIIDQRILIPAAPEIVWACVSDIDNNVKWQVGCQSISYLSSRRSGPGARWRSTGPNRREQVMEITAWYDGLGYEYTVVDGFPFASAKGRLRLQEIPEGTIVQWTFTFEPKGIAGGLRSSLGARKRIENAMVESLRNLWRYVNQSGGAQRTHEAKSLMRDALDYEARVNYKPRHPSAFEERNVQRDQPTVVIPEPPVSEEDTRPHLALQSKEPARQDTATTQDAEHKKDAISAPAPLVQSDQLSPVDVDSLEGIAHPSEPQYETTAEPTPTVDNEKQSDYAAATNRDDLSADSSQEAVQIAEAPRLAALDTSQLSIWDIFGVPRPSEVEKTSADIAPTYSKLDVPTAAPDREPTKTVVVEDQIDSAVPIASSAPDALTSTATPPLSAPQAVVPAQPISLLGMRAIQRRTLVNLRRR